MKNIFFSICLLLICAPASFAQKGKAGTIVPSQKYFDSISYPYWSKLIANYEIGEVASGTHIGFPTQPYRYTSRDETFERWVFDDAAIIIYPKGVYYWYTDYHCKKGPTLREGSYSMSYEWYDYRFKCKTEKGIAEIIFYFRPFSYEMESICETIK